MKLTLVAAFMSVAAMACSAGITSEELAEEVSRSVATAVAVAGELPTPQSTVTPQPIPTPRATVTPQPIATPQPTITPQPVPTPVSTATPQPTSTPQPSPTPQPSTTPRPTVAALPQVTIPGSGDLNTESFTVTQNPWRLDWFTTNTSLENMVVYLVDPETGTTLELLANDLIDSPTESTTFVYGQVGTFYFDINGPSASEGGWTITIIDGE